MINLKKSIIPLPKEISEKGKSVKISSFAAPVAQILTDCDDERIATAVNIINQKIADMTCVADFDNKGTYIIEIKVDPDNSKFTNMSDEAYFLETSTDKTVICGKTAAGAYYGAHTLCKMMFSDGDDLCVPEAYIFDYPDFKYRGHFIECRYGTEFMTKEDWFGVIDYMASMKSNQLTIGVYGCWGVQYDDRKVQYLYVPIKKYPQLQTLKNIKYYSVDKQKWINEDNLLPKMFEDDFFGELIQYGKKHNVTVKPLFNSLGHNTLLPQHFPEISSKTETGESSGFGFCTKTDKTYEIMFDIYDEIIDRYLIPNGIYDIEIGLDEVGVNYICHCDKCEGIAHSELMVEYIIKVCKYLKKRGMKRIYIYHDMLYNNFDIVNEELKQRFIDEGIYDEVVLDWWTYEDPAHLFWDKAEGVNNLFHSVIKPDTGYYHWAIPTENNENIRACVKMASDLGFEGVETYSSYEKCYDKNYNTLADVTWNVSTIDEFEEFNERYAYINFPGCSSKALEALKAMSDIMKDETGEMYMNRVCYRFEYYFYGYKKNDKPYPQNFPGDAYELFEKNEGEYLPYFEYLKDKSGRALEFFENNGLTSRINSIWTLNARHYYTIADEYLTLYQLWKSYNKDLVDEYEVINQLDRLIAQREELMLLAERVRMKATSYTYLRNMSVFRQFMTDLSDYFKKEISCGKKPVLDMKNLSYATGKKLKFVQ